MNRLDQAELPQSDIDNNSKQAAIAASEYKKKVIARFGNKFDLSKITKITDSREPITIGCPKHGYFNTVANGFITTIYGCPKCAIINKTTAKTTLKDNFVTKANLRHDNKFDYSEVIYINNKTKVDVICPTHGMFSIRPDDHASKGIGCKQCSLSSRGKRPNIVKNLEGFVAKMRKLHGGKYTYEKTNFINSTTKMTVNCSKCGQDIVNDSNHFYTLKGCPDCSTTLVHNTDTFIAKAKRIHGGRYDYSKTRYINNPSKLTITCKVHGDFEQVADAHNVGKGCPRCSNNVMLTKEEFIDKVNKAKPYNYFDFSEVVIKKATDKVIIRCKKHDVKFLTRYDKITEGVNSCQLCNSSSYEKEFGEILDKLGIPYIQEYKIEPREYRYDFYIPIANLVIEIHGKQHYEYVDHFSVRILAEQIERDNNKKDICKVMNKNYIVIPYHIFDNNIDTEDRVEKALLISHKYWLIIGNELKAYKTFGDICTDYDLPGYTIEKTVIEELGNKTNEIIKHIINNN